MAPLDGEVDDYKRLGVDFLPHPITTEGRRNVVVPAGQTLEEAFGQYVPPDANAVATVNGHTVLLEAWHDVVLREGDVVGVRVVAGRGFNPFAALLSIAALVAAPYLAGFILGTTASAVTTTLAGQILTAGIGAGGILLANALFPPRLPNLSLGAGAGPAPRVYSLSGGSNLARPYEALPLLLGTHRMFPDQVAKEYREFDEDGNEILNQIFDFGIGNLRLTDERFGETTTTNYESVQTQKQVSRIDLVAGNVDTITGGDLGYVADDIHTIVRTTAAGTTKIAFDVVVQHFLTTNRGRYEGRDVFLEFAWRPVGTSAWTTRAVTVSTPDGDDARKATRRSYSYDVAEGRYDVRARPTAHYAVDDDLSRINVNVQLAAFRAYQPGTADFTGRNAYAVRAKATGQLYGRLESVNAIASQLIDRWTGSAWVANQATSNPGDILRKFLRGWYAGGKLVAGMGFADEDIDLESIQDFADHCTANELECNVVVEDGRQPLETIKLICQCGWGSLDLQSGKWGVVWEDANRPMTAVVTPANIIADSMNIAFDGGKLADEIIGNFIDRDSDYRENTIRRTAPGVDLPEKPVEIPLEGVVDGDHAAKEVNRAAAAQEYHGAVLTWIMREDEAKQIARGDVVGLTHGLASEGEGTRLEAISDDRIRLTPLHPVSAPGHAWIWDLHGNVLAREYTLESGVMVLNEALPAAPERLDDDPLAYQVMAFEESADLVTVRVMGKKPSRGRTTFTARYEDQQYYDHRTADLSWDPLADSLASHLEPVGNFLITEDNFGTRIYAWAPHPSPDVVGYRIRYAAAGTAAAGSWDTMSDLHDGVLQASPHEVIGRPGEGNWRFAIVAVLANGRRTTPTFYSTTLGVPGEQIANATWLFGAGDPEDENGEDGNLYLNTTNYTVWRKSNGMWSKIADLQGADGATWTTGAGLPDDADGADGDWYFRTSNAGIYRKVSGSWVFQVDIDGDDGATWHGGSGAPAGSLGEIGDWFFRTDQGYVYEKTASTTWTFRRDLTGPQGINGATWHTVSGVPSNALGANGDLAFRHDNNTVWRKSGGTWAQITDLSGADGATWFTGSGLPSGSLGVTGDWYFRTANAGIYRKTNSTTWTFQLDIDGEDGARWHSGSGVPSSSLGIVGDWYFRSSNGYVYEKTGSSTWTFRRDITGPQGPAGQQGDRGPAGPRIWQRLSGTAWNLTSSSTTYSRSLGSLSGYDLLMFFGSDNSNALFGFGSIPVIDIPSGSNPVSGGKRVIAVFGSATLGDIYVSQSGGTLYARPVAGRPFRVRRIWGVTDSG